MERGAVTKPVPRSLVPEQAVHNGLGSLEASPNTERLHRELPARVSWILMLLLTLLSSGLSKWGSIKSFRKPKADTAPQCHLLCCNLERILPSQSLFLLFLSLNTEQGKKEKELKYLCSYFMLGILTPQFSKPISSRSMSSWCIILIRETAVKQEVLIPGWRQRAAQV